jgi:AraC family transcriptional regulator
MKAHKASIHKALTYIEHHLDDRLTIEKVAEAAAYSPYHFHRIFSYLIGESVHQYIHRKRMVKAGIALVVSPQISIESLAFSYGFANSATFSRAFKQFHGITPSTYRKSPPLAFNHLSKNGKVSEDVENYICSEEKLNHWINMNLQVSVQKMPARHLAFLTHQGNPEKIGEKFQQLVSWSQSRLSWVRQPFSLMTIYHDSIKFTDPDKVRMSAFIELNQPIAFEDEVGHMQLPELHCLTAKVEVKIDEFEKLWTGMYVKMSHLGYRPSDDAPFEIYHNHYKDHPEQKFILTVCIPIKPKTV